jgi:hypothetical protein
LKKAGFMIALALLALPVLTAACSSQVSGDQSPLSQDQARLKAEQFLKECPTFAYDGITDSLVLEETLYPDIENTWTFVFKFKSRQAGFGDRSGQMLLQVITPHEASITIENGQVKNAIMDGEWDMIAQQLVD